MRSEYLLFNCFVVLGPILVLFLHSRVVLIRPRAAILSIGIAALLFIIWDIIVTSHFWDFNPKYVLGYKLLTIPFEEALFFFTVSFACLFLYVNFMRKFGNRKYINPIFVKIISLFTIVLSLVFLLLGKYYTFAVLLLLGSVWMLDFFLTKTSLIVKYSYWQFMGLVLLLTAVFNYYLTSRPVVIYNNNFNLNYRFLTIPIEDFFYSIALISLVLILYEYYQHHASYKQFHSAIDC